MKIVAMKEEKYIGIVVEGHNCDFEYKDAELTRHILFGVLSDGRKVKITLSNSYGECGSGWTTASWGEIKVEFVDRFGGYTHRPKTELEMEDIFPDDDIEDISNHIFHLSCDGGDSYYPSGGYSIEMDQFIETVRRKEKRPVWIFTGPSNVGKSFIASKIQGLSVYETDSNSLLPDLIKEDIVVLGRKYPFKVEEVKVKLFGDCEVTIVNFEFSE